MEMTASWDDIEDYCKHFDFDTTDSNQKMFAPLKTFIVSCDEMELIQTNLNAP
jgi:hypothetical protein